MWCVCVLNFSLIRMCGEKDHGILPAHGFIHLYLFEFSPISDHREREKNSVV